MESTDFFKKVEQSFAENLPLVLFRLPGEAYIQGYVQSTRTTYPFDKFDEPGFVFAPFHDDAPKVIFPFKFCEHYTCLNNDLNREQDVSDRNTGLNYANYSLDDKNNHMDLVAKAQGLITSDEAKKIVVARQERVSINGIQLSKFFQLIEQEYPEAFVYFWSHPAIGIWAGASPERLFSLKKNEFSATALAGTQLWNEHAAENWTIKEIKEQQYVTDFIEDALKGLVALKVVSKPRTVKAGNLAHIRTDLYGELLESTHIEELINSLHPTPATCGLPKNTAKDFILNNELHPRAYYTGYMGVFDPKHETGLFVNLRCVQIKRNEAVLYIGGGITKDSDPEKEWEETVAKAETMKRVLD